MIQCLEQGFKIETIKISKLRNLNGPNKKFEI